MRNLRESDHEKIVSVADEWWGRPMTHNLPRLFFRHFEDTSFVVEEDEEIAAFLIGFVSQSRLEEAYIHFAGVHPAHRGRGTAKALYDRFFDEARKRGCERVRCITSSVNKTSIAFHRSLGFTAETCPDYDGDGKPKVVFEKGICGTETG
ncbi:MAG: GNAT family N-acetyltransferase [Actinomycetota bacterium]|jgi:ribosomal protein S18 acetylase RimI-like enzyme|nr:GNAT family N-acetyltransferase [Actinomycetota bacterium]